MFLKDIILICILLFLIYSDIKYFLKSPKTSKSLKALKKRKKGLGYEDFVAHLYKKRGYKVWERGRELGVKDGGIDLVAYRWNKTLLIQCKNWNPNHQWKIQKSDIEYFRRNIIKFLKENPKYKKLTIKGLFIVSDKGIMDKKALEYIKKNKNIELKIIPPKF